MSVDADTPLYKYLGLDSFLFLMANRTLRFSKITDWPDKFEGGSYRLFSKLFNDNPISLDSVWGSCWTTETDIEECYNSPEMLKLANAEIQKHGNAGMWETYCGGCGVRVKSTVRKVREVVEESLGDAELCDGEVKYVPNVHISKNFHEMLFHKRTPFRYENEYRFIVLDRGKSFRGFEVPLGDPYAFFDEMLVGPSNTKNQWIVDTLYQAIAGSAGLGCNSNGQIQFARKSGLYEHASETLTGSWLRFKSCGEVKAEYEAMLNKYNK